MPKLNLYISKFGIWAENLIFFFFFDPYINAEILNYLFLDPYINEQLFSYLHTYLQKIFINRIVYVIRMKLNINSVPGVFYFQLCGVAKLVNIHKEHLAKFGYRTNMNFFFKNNPFIFLLLPGTHCKNLEFKKKNQKLTN